MFLTVFNVYTRQSVPYKILETGEIQITSPDPADNEDTCIVKITKMFYEFSLDFERK